MSKEELIFQLEEAKKSERAIKEIIEKIENSAEELRLIEFLPVPIFIYHYSKCMYANKKALELLEIEKREDILGTEIMRFVHPDSVELIHERRIKLYDHKQAVPFVTQKLITAKGTVIDIVVGSVPISYGEKTMVLSVAKDITKTKQTTRELNYTNELLKSYICENEKLMFQYRRLHHNALNIFHGLNGYIFNEDWEGLKVYVDQVGNQLNILKDTSLLAINNIKNLSLRGLLTVKLSKAKELGLNFKLEVQDAISISDKYIREPDLCEVLGVYLDNAIEASEASPTKKVSVYILNDEKETRIIVENTFGIRPDINSINLGVSTKGKERGLGLKICRSILNQYSNILNNTFIQHQVFVQELHLLKGKTGDNA